MDTFEFTKKKFTSLSIQTQHRHIINWLSEFYQKLTTNRITNASFDLFSDQYSRVLQWAVMKPFIRPESDNIRIWIEVISDRIHYHRSAITPTSRDYDLLEKVKTGDLQIHDSKINLNCHIALDGIRSLFNVGSIFRTCDAAGFNSIILGNIPGKDHPGIQKTSMGAHEWVKEEITSDLAQTLIRKKKNGFQIVGIETIKDSVSYFDFSWKEKTIIVFGNEEYGISSHVLNTCDDIVHIPMQGKKNSINVASAVSIICFDIVRTLTK